MVHLAETGTVMTAALWELWWTECHCTVFAGRSWLLV